MIIKALINEALNDRYEYRLCQNSKLSYLESSVSIRLFQSSRFE